MRESARQARFVRWAFPGVLWLWGCAPSQPASAPSSVSAFRFKTDAGVLHSIPLSRLVPGTAKASPKDAIPAIRRPRSLPASESAWIADDDEVVGVAEGGAERAYPVKMLDRHEIVNDRLGDLPIAVTYCPLCDSAMVWRRDGWRRDGDAERRGEALVFGCSGYLVDDDVVIYDEATETFWQQLNGRAIAGPRTGGALDAVPLVRTTWGAWKAKHPQTTALSFETEHGLTAADYAESPYASYRESGAPMFAVSKTDDRLRLKSVVYGLEERGDSLAVPASLLVGRTEPFETTVSGARFRLVPDPALSAWRAEREGEGETEWKPAPLLRCYWFAWFAFHPQTRVASGPDESPR